MYPWVPLRIQRPVKTGLNQFFAVFWFSKLPWTIDWTMVFSLCRSLLFVVLISYGLVQLRSFSSFVTRLPNTNDNLLWMDMTGVLAVYCSWSYMPKIWQLRYRSTIVSVLVCRVIGSYDTEAGDGSAGSHQKSCQHMFHLYWMEEAS